MTRVIIDAGHGGNARAGNSSAFGARGAAGTIEKDVTLDIARHVVQRLGNRAALTRTSDVNLTLGARAARARGGPGVFVSIHANSGPPDASGPETFVHPAAGRESRRLAEGVQRALDRLRGRYGGVAAARPGRMAVLDPRAVGRDTSACLVEVDYLSNPRSEERLRDPAQRAAIGAAIASAIEDHVSSRQATAFHRAYGQAEGAPDGSVSDVPELPAQTEMPDVETVDETSNDSFADACEALLRSVPASEKEQARTAVPALLQACVDLKVHDSNQVAYILATAEHESGFGTPRYGRSTPLVEDHNPYIQDPDGTWSATVHLNGKKISAPTEDELDQRYWDACYGGRLGNEPGTSDAADYRGRGYAQLTGRNNYQDLSQRLNDAGISYSIDGVTYGGDGPPIDLVANPTHVNRVPDIAALILVLGSTQGAFTGKALDDYINADGVDFYNARSVINNDKAKNGKAIADIASGFAARLDAVWPRVIAPPDTESNAFE